MTKNKLHTKQLTKKVADKGLLKTTQQIQNEAIHISYLCQYSGLTLTKLFLACLTHCNFHDFRKKVAQLTNKEFNTKLRLEG